MARQPTSRWTELAVAGAEFSVVVRPGARLAQIEQTETGFRVSVTAPPEDGKANDAVRDLLADALGVAKSRLTLIRGATSRQKRFRLD